MTKKKKKFWKWVADNITKIAAAVVLVIIIVIIIVVLV